MSAKDFFFSSNELRGALGTTLAGAILPSVHALTNPGRDVYGSGLNRSPFI